MKTDHRIIRMKSANVKSGTYIENSVENNQKDPKFKFFDHVRIIEIKNNFQKTTHQIRLKESLWMYVFSDLNDEEIFGIFYERGMQNTSQKQFKIEKRIKRKHNRFYAKWMSYDNSLNS